MLARLRGEIKRFVSLASLEEPAASVQNCLPGIKLKKPQHLLEW
jgi:hypothetical protein